MIVNRVFWGKTNVFPKRDIYIGMIFLKSIINTLFETKQQQQQQTVGAFSKTKRLTNEIGKTLRDLVISFCSMRRHRKPSLGVIVFLIHIPKDKKYFLRNCKEMKKLKHKINKFDSTAIAL